VTTIVVAVLAAVLALAGPAAAQTVIPADDGGRFYGRAEYLLWWTKDSPQRDPLVTNGFFDQAGTQVLMGGNDIDTGRHNGGRLTLGYWLTEDHTWGVEASGFYLPTVTRSQAVSSSGAPGSVHLVVPFFDPTRNAESFTDVSSAGEFSGSATQRLRSRLWGAEGSVVIGLANPGPWRLDLLGGIRYLNLSEGFSFATSSPDLPPGPVTVFRTKDEFDANNDFYGGQVGLRGRYLWGRFTADATVKVAVGAMRQHLDVAGSLTTNFFSPPIVQTFGGGIFAQTSNIGSHRRDIIAVVPEAGLNVGFRLTDWATILVGYSFLYASDVVRPGSQIDRVINPTQSQAISLNNPATLSGVARPTFRFQSSDFWAHGLNAGFAFTF
jgi:putative beta barrel porin BBP7